VLVPGVVTATLAGDLDERAPRLAFARQFLPDAQDREAASVRAWAGHLLASILPVLPDEQPWSLHVLPHYGRGTAGRHRCRLIRQAVLEELKRQRRHLLRRLRAEAAPFGPQDALVQLVLSGPETGWISVAAAPKPQRCRHHLSAHPGGVVPVPEDKTPPARAYAKLLEAEQRLGRAIAAGEHCVDLGASPGSWSHVALARGARVTAVDRAPLRDDLMRHPLLHFQRGDAFRFQPEAAVDWLLCDVIAAPERSQGLLLEWLSAGLCRRFVLTLKFKGDEGYAGLDAFQRELLQLTTDYRLMRLDNNRNEVCVFGAAPGA